MNIGFHTNQLSVRGTETAIFDYANYNETLLHNNSYIFYPYGGDVTALNKFRERFNSRVICYASMNELKQLCHEYDIKVMYWIKYGTNDGKYIANVKNVVHSVFNVKEPHGDVYAYVSEWLAKENGMDYVPHIVTLPDIKQDYREALGIPKDALVFGRHGGADTFDIDYVHKVVSEIARTEKNIYFLFLNTNQFALESYYDGRIIHFEPSSDVESKTAFINTCDAMLHGRKDGESFGLAVCEFLHQNKPIITNIDCRDKHHISILKDKGFYYTNGKELHSILSNFKKSDFNYSSLVSQFCPSTVMYRFKNVFLD